MKNGFAVEIGDCKSIIKTPENKYIQDLIGSIPTLDKSQNWLDLWTEYQPKIPKKNLFQPII